MNAKNIPNKNAKTAVQTAPTRIVEGNIPSARVHAWNQQVAKLFNENSVDGQMRILADAISSLIPCDHWYFIYFRRDEPPIMAMYSNLRDKDNSYSDGPYIIDPFYNAFASGVSAGCYRLKDFANEDYSKIDDYREFLSEIAGPLDEIGLIWPLDDQTAAHICLYRFAGVSDFRPEHVEAMQITSPIVETVMRRAWQEKFAPADGEKPSRTNYHENVSRLFEQFGKSVLTVREAEIAKFLIKGFSAQEIGNMLGVSAGTVRNHMKKIYLKLDVSTQAELCALFIEDLVNLAAA